MSTPPPPAGQFWLLIGEVPAGPYTLAQVHAELAAGRATWQTPACPVGGSSWLPLVKTPGLGPEPQGAGGSTAAGSAPGSTVGDPGVPAAGCPAGAVTTQPPVAAGETPAPAARNGHHLDGWQGFVGFVIAMLLVGGLVWGGKWVSSQFGWRKPDTTAGVPGSAPNPLLTPPPAGQPAAGTAAPPPTPPAASHWNLGGPPRLPASMQDPAALLVGSWRWDAGGGYSSTFAFEAGGAFTYYAAGANPLLNLPVAGCEAYGRWSVRDGTLFVEFTGASDPALVPLFRGRTARSPVRFTSENAVRLSGVEGDATTRTYARVR
jgi:hypothetical protein